MSFSLFFKRMLYFIIYLMDPFNFSFYFTNMFIELTKISKTIPLFKKHLLNIIFYSVDFQCQFSCLFWHKSALNDLLTYISEH